VQVMTAPAETRAGDFAEFVTARSARLLRVAYLLTRDWALAEDLLQTSLAKAWTAWRRIEGDPEPYVRRILVNTYTSWWRRRWHHERPTDELPERPGPDQHAGYDDRDQLTRALGRLPRQQRAVLVLRYYEDLSEAQIADALGISAGTVKSHAAKAIARLRMDPELAAGSLEPDSEPPDGVARLAAVQDRIQQARHRRVAAVGSACAVILALLIGYAINPAHLTHPQPSASPSLTVVKPFPEYQMGTRLVATATATPSQPTAQLAWTASTPDIVFFLRCRATAVLTTWITITAGRSEVGELGCETSPDHPDSGGSSAGWPQQQLVKAGIVKGARAELTVTMTVEKGMPTPSDLAVDVAVGERVSWSEYPFPDKPGVLASLDSNRLDQVPGVVELRPPAGSPADPATATLTWGKPYALHLSLISPGILHVLIEGVEVQTCTSWGYSTFGCGYPLDPVDKELPPKLTELKPGDTVKVEVSPEHVTEDWAVWIAPSG